MRRLGRAFTLAILIGLSGALSLDAWVRATPIPPLAPVLSSTVVDRDGKLLRAFTAVDARWRLPVELADVDPGFVAQLIAFEDRRFFDHSGVDPLAFLRAGWQAIRHGRIVSGGSTLTMQVARLVTRRETKSVMGKLRQIRLALALERKLEKPDILELYLHLAPYGGNVEGIRAASLRWFGKPPRRLTEAEAAALVALPQAPETRRPDRGADVLRRARDRVLERSLFQGILDAETVAAARRDPVPEVLRPMPMLAPHLAAAMPKDGRGTTIDATLQGQLQQLVGETARRTGQRVSAAMIVVDHRTGEILAQIGSADLTSGKRQGWIDMTRAIRSPGSTLKPFIYGLAFDAGLAHPETLIDDRPMRFDGYAPSNFDGAWRGPLSVRRALQQSLNVPAVAMLSAVGLSTFTARLRRTGVTPVFPRNTRPGLPMALGGVGLTLHDLVTLYAAIARGGRPVTLRHYPGEPEVLRPLMSRAAAWHLANILSGTPPPVAGGWQRIAFKTGTSYGYRDAWAIGFDGAHVIGVWIGRPDGTPMPGALGIDTAAPLLFEAFGRLKDAPVRLAPPPPETLTLSHDALPPHLRVFSLGGMAELLDGPEIIYPPDGARVDLGLVHDPDAPLIVKVSSGRPPYLWIINGHPHRGLPTDRQIRVNPGGKGFIGITVVDASGASTTSRVFVE